MLNNLNTVHTLIFFNSHSGVGGGWSPYWVPRHGGHFWPIVPAPGDCGDGEFCGMKNGRGNHRSTWKKNCPSATLSSINPTWTDPGANSGRCGRKLESNRSSYGPASVRILRKRSIYVTLCRPSYGQGFSASLRTVYVEQCAISLVCHCLLDAIAAVQYVWKQLSQP
jgi:hypothetical protein